MSSFVAKGLLKSSDSGLQTTNVISLIVSFSTGILQCSANCIKHLVSAKAEPLTLCIILFTSHSPSARAVLGNIGPRSWQ